MYQISFRPSIIVLALILAPDLDHGAEALAKAAKDTSAISRQDHRAKKRLKRLKRITRTSQYRQHRQHQTHSTPIQEDDDDVQRIACKSDHTRQISPSTRRKRRQRQRKNQLPTQQADHQEFETDELEKDLQIMKRQDHDAQFTQHQSRHKQKTPKDKSAPLPPRDADRDNKGRSLNQQDYDKLAARRPRRRQQARPEQSSPISDPREDNHKSDISRKRHQNRLITQKKRLAKANKSRRTTPRPAHRAGHQHNITETSRRTSPNPVVTLRSNQARQNKHILRGTGVSQRANRQSDPPRTSLSFRHARATHHKYDRGACGCRGAHHWHCQHHRRYRYTYRYFTYPKYLFYVWVNLGKRAHVVYRRPQLSQDRYGQGWDALFAARYEEALTQFSNNIRVNTHSGIPRVGYALAAAKLDMLAWATWAMRTAFRLDPHSLSDWQTSDLLHLQVNKLIGRYESLAITADHQADLAFMIAALHYLLGQTEAAHDAITMTISTGDRKTSTMNLINLINATYMNMSGQDLPIREPITRASNTTPAAQGK